MLFFIYFYADYLLYIDLWVFLAVTLLLKKNSRNSLCFHLESHSSSLKTLRVRILIYFEFLLLVYISEFCGALLVLIHTNCGNSEVK